MHDKYIDQHITTVDISTSIFLPKTFRLHNFPFSDRTVHAIKRTLYARGEVHILSMHWSLKCIVAHAFRIYQILCVHSWSFHSRTCIEKHVHFSWHTCMHADSWRQCKRLILSSDGRPQSYVTYRKCICEGKERRLSEDVWAREAFVQKLTHVRGWPWWLIHIYDSRNSK